MTENENLSAQQSAEANATEKSPRKRKRGVTIAVTAAVVLVVAGCGMFVWHEQPSFCGAICHTPMSGYVEAYDAEPNAAGVDAYGNEVSNTNAMLTVVHASAGQDCLSCHEPTLDQQVSEGIAWATGDYEFPLQERSITDLALDPESEDASEAFCLRSGCHDAIGITSREDLEEATADMELNPHTSRHGDIDCGACHKAHRASTMICTQCHMEAYDELPEGWVSYQDAEALNLG